MKNLYTKELSGPPLKHEDWLAEQAKLQQSGQADVPTSGLNAPKTAQAPVGGGVNGQQQQQQRTDEPVIAGRPLSAYDGKSDADLDKFEGVGPAAIREIHRARADRK